MVGIENYVYVKQMALEWDIIFGYHYYSEYWLCLPNEEPRKLFFT